MFPWSSESSFQQRKLKTQRLGLSLLTMRFVVLEAIPYGTLPASFSLTWTIFYIFPGLQLVTLQAFWPHRGTGTTNAFASATCNPSRSTSTQAEFCLHLLSAAPTLIIASTQVPPASRGVALQFPNLSYASFRGTIWTCQIWYLLVQASMLTRTSL